MIEIIPHDSYKILEPAKEVGRVYVVYRDEIPGVVRRGDTVKIAGVERVVRGIEIIRGWPESMKSRKIALLV